MLSSILALLIVSAFSAAVVFLLGYLLGSPALFSIKNAAVIGFSSGLAGLFGPLVAACILKRKDC